MPTLKPFRDYSEHDVINLFGYSGTLPVNKGTFVKVGVGWTTEGELRFMGSVGASYPNTVNERFGVPSFVTACDSGDAALGLLLQDVKEVDENGLPLKFNPTKAAAIGAVISGQAVPILKRGLVLYSGIQGTVATNSALYTWTAGALSTTGAASHQVGTALGPKDSRGFVLVKLDL